MSETHYHRTVYTYIFASSPLFPSHDSGQLSCSL